MAEFASKGVAGTGLGLGIAGTALSLLNNGCGNGILGNVLGGGCGARAAGIAEVQYVSDLQAKVQGLEAEKVANANMVAAFNQSVANDKELRAEMYAYIKPLADEAANNRVEVARLQEQLKCCCDKQELREQIILGKINEVALTANNGLTALAGTVSCLQNTVAGITKTVIPASALCPQPMPLYNSWTAPAAGAPTNTNIANADAFSS